MGTTNIKPVPGYFSSQPGYNPMNNTSYSTALLIKDDLISLGFNNVYVTAYFPLNLGFSEVIAVRLSTDGVHDFHVMKYNASYDGWDHKPSSSAPLRFIANIENNFWTNEHSKSGICYNIHDLKQMSLLNPPDIHHVYYGTSIYYIVFDHKCIFQYESLGISNFMYKHKKTCIKCLVSINEVCSKPSDSLVDTCWFCYQNFNGLGGYGLFNDPHPLKLS